MKSKIVVLLCVNAVVVYLWCPVHVADSHAETSLGEPHATHGGTGHIDSRVKGHEYIDHQTGENCDPMAADITRAKFKPPPLPVPRNSAVSLANPAPALQLPGNAPRTKTTILAHRASLFRRSVLIRI